MMHTFNILCVDNEDMLRAPLSCSYKVFHAIWDALEYWRHPHEAGNEELLTPCQSSS